MPNWCFNEMTVTGEENDVAKFVAEVANKEQPLSFAQIVPIPKEATDDRYGHWARNILWGDKWDAVGAKLVDSDERDLDTVDLHNRRAGRCLLVLHAPSDGENVNRRIVADHGNGSLEDSLGRPFPCERVTDPLQRLENIANIGESPFDQDVDLRRRADIPMEDARHAADHQVVHPGLVERRAHVRRDGPRSYPPIRRALFHW